ncbi:hypothetical protein [Siccirubricoccus phaeus]|uniref:hypothetical protein n=1 Tax=Siccirubricoccus phaeus TaxID=2595053 RepID=UPI0011F0F42C|nr:hypothetical protein [Siccirubricoccus phaeus]
MRPILPAHIVDAGLVRFRAGMQRSACPALPPVAAGQVRFGAGMRRGAPAIADAGRVRLGAGMRRG